MEKIYQVCVRARGGGGWRNHVCVLCLKYCHNLSLRNESVFKFKENWCLDQYLKRKKTVKFCYTPLLKTDNFLESKKPFMNPTVSLHF